MPIEMKVKVMNLVTNQTTVIKLPLSDKQLTDRMWRLGIRETIPKAVLSEVLEEKSPLKQLQDQLVNVDELNFLAKRAESLTAYEWKKIIACCEVKQIHNLKVMINLTYSLHGISLIDDYRDIAAMGKKIYLDVHGGITESEALSIDFEEYARDYMERISGRQTVYGTLLPHDFPIAQVYDGQVFPEYFYETNIVMSIAISNQAGLEDYLYLPTDVHSLNKVKERLNVKYFSECIISKMQNMMLPDEIFQLLKINDSRDLDQVNEMCKAVKEFDDTQMVSLKMVAEYAGITDAAAITILAKHLDTFEINPWVHNDAEYGKIIAIYRL